MNPAISLSIGMDIGTSGIRSAVLDQDNRLISMARSEHEPTVAEDALAWERAVYQCLERQIEKLPPLGYHAHHVKHLTIDGTSGSMVLTDAALNPVTRALLYNTHGFVTEAEVIAAHAPDPHITRGHRSALARALCLVKEDKDKKAKYLMHQADFIAARFMQKGGYSDDNNCLKTGFDPITCWPDWIIKTGMPASLLPKALPVGSPICPVDCHIGKRFGFSETTLVHAGTTDSVAAFLAASPLKQGHAVTSLGTTLAIKMLVDKRIDIPELGIYSHRLGDKWLAGCALNVGGGLLLKHFSLEQLSILSAQIDPTQPDGLDDYLSAQGKHFSRHTPTWLFEHAPRHEDDAIWLSYCLESLARIEKFYYDEITTAAQCPLKMLYSAGGGAKNTVWQHMRERQMALSITQAEHTEAAIGTARCPIKPVY